MTSESSRFLVPALAAAVLLLCAGTPCASARADQDDQAFDAKVLLDDGTLIRLTDFHLGTGYYRHRLSTGRQPLLLPLETVERIERLGDSADAIRVVFTNGTAMTTVWRHPGAQRPHGTLPDGSPWEGTIGSLREIVILRPAGEVGEGPQSR